MNDTQIALLLSQGHSANDIARSAGGFDHNLFAAAVQVGQTYRIVANLPCLHDRVLGRNGWTCVGCGDTVPSLAPGERPYDTSNDF